ncbi:hypothetical protein [Anaerosolibacter sp.]|uniref:hypothetical protein n=1 Tax=Anaerosolibacter sp. TaxID=1872527 RepID=UPI0039EF29FC
MLLLIARGLYLVLIAFVVYRMFKGGGCCGGHGHRHHGEESPSNYMDNKTITDEEKKNAVDIV